ncbi:pyruvate formate lyase-activating protein [Bifidobacterium primatium]|uniref:Pyruvate formate lyase-activating protein n=1 Tax=Bifidobacterium primatium TaxID=2045438 RepID=A0A2M9H6Q4_9BIFI|nr:glycyl-radical enzyme activating protein [Bifidobacterium primatium]PJM72499.1 pyruvate formate lyase-activating protein [Bifidobacterium primatium]
MQQSLTDRILADREQSSRPTGEWRRLMPQDSALVFNIQHYSLHDGPGIRTIVFLKGCPLRCPWCSNPESQRFGPEVSYVADKCIASMGCNRCALACPSAVSPLSSVASNSGAASPISSGFPKPGEASSSFSGSPSQGELSAKPTEGVDPTNSTASPITLNHPELDRLDLTELTAFAKSCPSKALTLEGKPMTVDEVLDVVERDEVFFDRSGGGLTVSGGEPLAHRAFLTNLLAGAHDRSITTAIETCGYAPYASLASAAEHLDNVLFDIKSMDDANHREWTGFGNKRILDNFSRLCADHPEIPKLVRTPIIPGFNDSRKDVAAIIDFLHGLGGREANITYQPLKYHRFGEGKYHALGRDYPMGSVKLDDNLFNAIRDDVLASGLAADALYHDDDIEDDED